MTVPGARIPSARVECPCCGYPTLTEPGTFEICILCWWEDDGQGDADADVVRGGPNGALSLSAARANFKDHLTMYAIGHDTRVGGHDSVLEVEAKRAIMRAFERLRTGVDDRQPSNTWAEIERRERELRLERAHKAGGSDQR